MTAWSHETALNIMDYPTSARRRWSKNRPPLVVGEAEHIANSADLSRTEVVATVLPFVHTGAFLPPEPRQGGRRFASGLGAALAMRTRHLTDNDTKANTILKMWMRSSREEFSTIHLPKMLRWVSGNEHAFVHLPSVLDILDQWDASRDEIITVISWEYFQHQQKDETNL